MYKIYITSNYFYIVDIDAGNTLYEGFAKDVRVRRLTENSTDFAFDNVNQWSKTNIIPFSSIQLTGAPYNNISTFIDVNNFKTSTNYASATTKKLFHFFWCSCRRYIVVFGINFEQKVAHRTANKIGRMTCILQGFNDGDSSFIYCKLF